MDKRTKIVATIGPSASSPKTLKAMVKEGVNVFRINFSHGSHDDHIKAIEIIRQVDQDLGTHTALLADLQGPKIRIGEMPKEGLMLQNKQDFYLTTLKKHSLDAAAYISLEQLPRDVKKGEKILLDDGKIHLEVIETNKKDTVKTKVIAGGILYSRKGVNLPDTNISVSSLTKKDKKDLKVAIDQDVDWIGFSFVRSAREVIELKHMISNLNGNAKVIAKIEKPEAVDDLNAILEETDAVMVARGDLGVEIPLEKVPIIQKKIVNMAQDLAKPVIIATQMMESMMDSLTPSRAEVNDVANSIIDGADAVMLSGETSVGKYPVEVIKQISKIIDSVEYSSLIKVPENPPTIKTNRYITKAICYHASHMADEINAKAIMTLTNSGYTAFQISAWRPHSNILVFTSNKRILNRLSLLWGVKAFYYNKFSSTDITIEEITEIATKEGYISKGDFTISLAAMPIKAKGMVNTLRVNQVT